MEHNRISRLIIGAAIEVHKELGPGKDEPVYEEALARELSIAGLPFTKQKPVPVVYKGQKLDCGYRTDIVACNAVVVEAKVVESVAPIHLAQLLTYLRLGNWKLGLLINFNVAVLKQGVTRLVQGLEPGYNVAARDVASTTTPFQHVHCRDGEAERLAAIVVDSATAVYRELGPGLLASAYEACLCRELFLRGVEVVRKKSLELNYKGHSLQAAEQLEMVVGEKIVVSPRAVTALLAVHNAQVISQIRLGGYPIGLLINFNESKFANGIRRFINSRAI